MPLMRGEPSLRSVAIVRCVWLRRALRGGGELGAAAPTSSHGGHRPEDATQASRRRPMQRWRTRHLRLSPCRSNAPAHRLRARSRSPVAARAEEEQAAAPRAEVKAARKAELPPLPKPRPKLSEPVAGQLERCACRDRDDRRGRAGGEGAQADRARLGHAGAHRRPERDQRRDEERDGARQRRRAAAARGARRGAQDHRGGQRDRAHAVQVGRRPRPLPRHGLRLLGLRLLRALRGGADRRPERLRRPHELGQGRPGQVGHDLLEPRSRLHGGGGHPLRHLGRQRPPARAGRTTCAAAGRASSPATRPVSNQPR